jgi:hypothetical protein
VAECRHEPGAAGHHWGDELRGSRDRRVATELADRPHELETMEPEEALTPELLETLDHPTLGTAVAILDDRGRTRRNLALGLVWTAIGALGVAMGVGDTTSGDGVGVLFGSAGLVVLLFGLNEIRLNALRLLRPVRLIVGDRGFAFATGSAPIMWQDVAAVEMSVGQRDPQPTGIRVRVRPASEGTRRPSSRPGTSSHEPGQWISIGGGTAMPLPDVVDLMRKHVRPDTQRHAPTTASKTHPGRTSRH